MTAEGRSGIQFQRLFDLDNCIVISTSVIQEVRQSRLKERIQRIEADRFFVFRNRLVQSTKPTQTPRINFICPGQISLYFDGAVEFKLGVPSVKSAGYC